MTTDVIMTRIGDDYRFTGWPGLSIEVARVHQRSDETTAEITVYSDIPPRKGLLHSARINIESTVAKGKLAAALTAREEALDWDGMVEIVCWRVREAYREGDPSINLRTHTPSPSRWVYYPYIESGGPTIIAGDGASGKSLLALYIALRCALGAPAGNGGQPNAPIVPLYLDWETEADTHTYRLRALAAGLGIDIAAMPDIIYRRLAVPLVGCASTIRREADKINAGLIIVDSLGAAAAGAPEESEAILQAFQAVRSAARPTLILHHKRKRATGERGGREKDRVFGSVYAINMARMVWDMQRTEEEIRVIASLRCIKVNNGRPPPQHAVGMTFTNDDRDTLQKIEIGREDISANPELVATLSMRDRILAWLTDNGKQTALDVSEGLSIDKSTAQVRLSELRKKGLVVSLPGNLWGRAAREANNE